MPGGIRFVLSGQRIINLQNAVDKYNDSVARMQEMSFDEFPLRTTWQRELSNISSLSEYKETIRRLNAASAPGADTPVYFRDRVVPDYLMTETERAERARTSYKKEQIERVFGDEFDTMSYKEKLARAESMLDGVEDVGGEYLDALLEEKHSMQVEVWYENYESVVIDSMLGSQRNEILRILDRFKKENPEALRNILERGDPEATIEYIYYFSAFLNKGPETRHQDAVNYWLSQELETFGNNEVTYEGLRL